MGRKTKDSMPVRTPQEGKTGGGNASEILRSNGLDNQEENDRHDYRNRLLHTAVLYWGFIAMGWVSGQRGAAFLDLVLVAQTDVAQGSLLFTVAALASIMAAIAGGYIVDKVRRPLLQFACGLFLNAALLPLIPLCTHLYLMAALFFLTSLGLVAEDIAANTLMAQMWREKKGHAFMQGLHFCFALGAILSPLATEPFLASQHHHSELLPHHNKTCNNCSQTNEVQFAGDGEALNATRPIYTNGENHNTAAAHTQDTGVFYAFLQSSMICLSCVVLAFLLSWFPVASEPAVTSRAKTRASVESRGKSVSTRKLQILARALAALFYMFGMNIGFGDFLMTFVVRELDWDKPSGARLIAVFWLGFAAMRFGGVVLVRLLSAATIIFLCLAAVMASFAGMLVAVLQHADWAVWTTSCTMGMSTALLFPTGLVYTSERITPLTGRIVSMFLVTSLLTAVTNTQLIPRLMENYDNKWYLYVLIIQLCVGIILFVSLHLVTVRLMESRSSSLLDVDINIKLNDDDSKRKGENSQTEI